MRPNPQFNADLVLFTEEIFNEKLHCWCSAGFSECVVEILLEFMSSMVYQTSFQSAMTPFHTFSEHGFIAPKLVNYSSHTRSTS